MVRFASADTGGSSFVSEWEFSVYYTSQILKKQWGLHTILFRLTGCFLEYFHRSSTNYTGIHSE
jgi:hypothetical protein